MLRRLVAQGRLGEPVGQGFYAYPRPDAGWDGPVKLETRGEVGDRLARSPPGELDLTRAVEALAQPGTRSTASGEARAFVIASANPNLFCAGADIKAFTQMDADGGRRARRRRCTGCCASSSARRW